MSNEIKESFYRNFPVLDTKENDCNIVLINYYKLHAWLNLWEKSDTVTLLPEDDSSYRTQRAPNYIVHLIAFIVAIIIIAFVVRRARADEPDRCGYSPLRTGPWDPFIRACTLHDYYYKYKTVEQQVADDAFAAVVRNIYTQASWWKRPFLTVWGEAYILIVNAVGEYFWNT